MRILMLGEYSGFYLNLKEGFEALGHDVVLLADGDGWKTIKGATSYLHKKHNNALSKILNKGIYPLFDNRMYDEFDAVMIINLLELPLLTHFILKKMKERNKRVFLSACGYDYALYEAFQNGKFEYYMFDETLEELPWRRSLYWKYYSPKQEFNDIRDYITMIIPVADEYTIGYQNLKCNISNCIPFPINTKKIKYTVNNPNDRIVIFHGLNRESEKGTKYIVSALKLIQEQYGDLVEIIVDGHMQYDKYIKLMEKTNIVIDQCKSFGYGMNACLAMAQGKIVLSGASDDHLKAYGIRREECPVIPITPCVDDIVSALSNIINKPSIIPVISQKSRMYIEKYHDFVSVAKLYENIMF